MLIRPRLPLLILFAVLAVGCATVDPGPAAPADDAEAGVFTDRRGNATRIRWDDLVVTGQGSFTWPDGSTYQGAFVDGKPEGRGEAHYADGSHYTGTWQAGVRTGAGTLVLADDQGTYQGEFAGGLRHGRGTFEGPSGTYIGGWANDQPHGPGRFDYNTGAVYEGTWFQGARTGQGTFTASNGSRYSGTWRNNVPHGFGRIEEDGGFVYEGAWVAGERDGYGTFTDRNGVTYEGTWAGGQREGFGVERRPDGSGYEGDWTADRRHGQGRAWSAGGESHEGTFVEGLTRGPGVRRWRDGTTIEADWARDVPLSGSLTLPSGATWNGGLYALGEDDQLAGAEPEFLAWLQATAAAGDAWAQSMLAGHLLRFGGDRERVLALLGEAAAAGVPEAGTRLAELLLANGATDRALDLLHAAAAAGHPQANIHLGTFHQLGQYLDQDHATARDYYNKALASGDPVATNNLAWLLATSPDPAVRDGARAVQLMLPMTRYFPDWEYLDTLAAAHAEAGDFAAAASTQQTAMQRAEDRVDAEVLSDMQARLDQYSSEEPFRDASSVSSTEGP